MPTAEAVQTSDVQTTPFTKVQMQNLLYDLVKGLKQADDFRALPIYKLLYSLYAETHRVFVERKIEKDTFKGVNEAAIKAFTKLFGHEAIYDPNADRHMFQRITEITVNTETICLTGMRKGQADIGGAVRSVEVSTSYFIPLQLIADIFNEMEWYDVLSYPPREWSEPSREEKNPRLLARFGDGRMMYDMHPMFAMEAMIQRGVTNLIASGRVIIKPVGDGTFRVEIDGLAEEQAREEAAAALYTKRRRFAYEFSVEKTDTFAAWINQTFEKWNIR